MFEIDKKAFGIFVAELRKEKGLKQKELAAKLLISDKAVSKWETGLSMPDITLLVPLADILDVTVTELLECRRMTAETMTAVQTEDLLKKTISMSEAELTANTKSKRRWGAAYACCITVSCIEVLLFFLLGYSMELFFTHLLTVEILAAVFGIIFCLFIKEKLPSYYDNNQISYYTQGPLRMHLAGVSLNNSNWPYIVRVIRLWSLALLVLFPLLCLIAFPFLSGLAGNMIFLYITLGVTLGGLFVPVYIVAAKYK